MAKQHRRYYFLVANHYYGDSWNFGFHLAVKGGKGAVAAVNPNAVLARKRALAKFYGI